MTIDPQHLDFGEVRPDSQELAFHFPIRNDSARTIHVSELQTGCNCRPVEPAAFTLAPGETRVVRVTLTDHSRPEFAGRARTVHLELRPVIDGKVTQGWTARGVVRPRIEADSSAVMFGDSNRAGRPPVPRTLTVRFHQPGTADVKLVPDVADVEVRPGASAMEWKVTISPRTDRPAGSFRGTLTVANVPAGGGAPVATLELPVEGILSEGER